jgi:hypothetical protein
MRRGRERRFAAAGQSRQVTWRRVCGRDPHFVRAPVPGCGSPRSSRRVARCRSWWAKTRSAPPACRVRPAATRTRSAPRRYRQSSLRIEGNGMTSSTCIKPAPSADASRGFGACAECEAYQTCLDGRAAWRFIMREKFSCPRSRIAACRTFSGHRIRLPEEFDERPASGPQGASLAAGACHGHDGDPDLQVAGLRCFRPCRRP